MGIGAVVRVLTTPTGLEWILVVAILVIAVTIGILMGITMPKFRRMQSLVDRNNLVAREIVTGIMPVRAFGRQSYEQERYDKANRELTNTYIFTNRCMAALMPMMLIVMNATTVGIVWFGGQGVDAGNLMVGDLMAYINYVMQVIMSFMILTMISVMLPRADVAAERVQEVLACHSSIEDPVPAERVSRERGEGWHGVISYNDVTFTYPDAEEPTLEHISFTAEPGKTCAIIGSICIWASDTSDLFYDARIYSGVIIRIQYDFYVVSNLYCIKKRAFMIEYVYCDRWSDCYSDFAAISMRAQFFDSAQYLQSV